MNRQPTEFHLTLPPLVKFPRFKYVLILGLALLSGCSKSTDAPVEPPLRLVKTLQIYPQSLNGWREFPGVVEAAQTADLSFRVAGKLSQLLVDEGTEVNKEQILARLDDTDFKIQLSSRQAEFDQAKADYDRAKRLQQQQLIAQADVDHLKAQFTAAQAALDAAKLNVLYTELKAPFTGHIARRHVDNYEDIAASQSIFTLQDTSKLRVRVEIPETTMIHLKEQPSYTIYAIFDALQDQQFPLTIQSIAKSASPSSRTFSVTLSMPTVDNNNILPGMSVTVRGGQQEDMAMVVPPQAVLANEQGQFVFIAEPSENQVAVVQQRSVVVGEINEQGITIIEGINPGEQLVIAGMSKMYDGLEVRLDGDWSQ